MAKKQVYDAPHLDTDDALEVEESRRPAIPEEADSEYAPLVVAALAQMSGAEPDAEARYQATLQALSVEPQAAADTIAAIYRATPEDQYVERWSQVHLMSDLEITESLAMFEELLSTPIPPEKAPGMVTYSTVGEETMIRMTAVEGIGRLAARDDRKALAALREHTRHESFSVRRAAIQAYIDVVGEEGREELRYELPEEDQFILDVRRASIQEVPQPRVERETRGLDQPPPAKMPFGPRVDK